MAIHNGLLCEPNANTNGYDFAIKNGSIAIGNIVQQNQAFLLIGNKGEFEKPNVGVGIEDMINDHEIAIWQRLIMEQLEADGQRVDYLSVGQNGGIELTAHYIN